MAVLEDYVWLVVVGAFVAFGFGFGTGMMHAHFNSELTRTTLMCSELRTNE